MASNINSFQPWPCFSIDEQQAVLDVLKSNNVNYWTGDQGRKFEDEFSKYTDSNHSIALSNGTNALELALKALGVKAGDEVIVTSRTFLASVSCIINLEAIPIFADVDLNSQNITFDSISKVISPKTKVIICVHLAGWPCDMDPIVNFAKENNISVVEDCAQAHGARYKNRPIGSIGDIGCWSFCQDKIMSTGGEGGMVTTNNKTLWKKMWSYKDHGKSWDAVYKEKHEKGFRWLHESFGTNFRMTEMQAAIGRVQLASLDKWHLLRNKNANLIWSTAKEFGLYRVPVIPGNISHAAYKCYIFVNGSENDRNNILERFNEKGIPCFSGSCSEVYLEKAFDTTGFRPKIRLPNARELGKSSLAFLCHHTLSELDIERTCEAIKSVSRLY